MKYQKSTKSVSNLHRSQVAHACLTMVMAVAGVGTAPGAFAAAGFGDANDANGAPTRPQTYYAHTPSGVRGAIPPEAFGIMGAGYAGNTGAALRKFVDPLPQIGKPGMLSDGLTSKYIPKAVPVKWKNPAGVDTGDDYYEIAVVEYTEKLHSDLKNPTRIRGYVQIDHLASNGLGQIDINSKKVALTYPGGAPIMIPATDANGKLTGGAPVQALAYDNPHYLGPAIEATRNTPTRLKFHNLLPVGRYDAATGRNGDLFLPVDETLAGAGAGPDGVTRYTQNRAEIHLHGGDNPWISDGTPHQWIAPAGERAKLSAEMSAAGSPLPVDTFLRGPGALNVPDMNEPGEGAMTYYFPNRQSARLEWYHDHSYGLTRLNVYAGMVAPYVLSDPGQDNLLHAVAGFPTDTIHLVIQDKTFVPEDIKLQDGRWNAKVDAAGNHPLAGKPLWGEASDMWYPHVYEVNQDPSNGIDGTNPVGRWDWGPYFWPVFPSLYNLPTGGVDDVTLTPEAWMDTPVVNGVAYPTLSVQPRAQRFKILNGANDRFWNLSFFVADSAVSEIKVISGGTGYVAGATTVAISATTGSGATAEPVIDAVTGAITAIRITNAGTGYSSLPGASFPTVTITGANTGAAITQVVVADNTEVKMVPAGPIETTGLAACTTDPVTGADIAFPYADACQPSTWPTDGRAGGVPDPRTAGPKIYQIGNEGGLLPRVAEIAAAPMQYEYNRRSVTVLNTFSHGLFLGNAERADILVDFSGYEGKTLILYSDAPAPVPAFDPRNDHWTGKPDETTAGSVETPMAGFGPNTRTVMQIKVENSASAATAAVNAANAQMTAANLAKTAADGIAATDAADAAAKQAALTAANAAMANAQVAFNAAKANFIATAIATPPPSLEYDAALAAYSAASVANTLAISKAAAAQTAYNTASAKAITSAAVAANAALAVNNAQNALTAALAAQAAVAGGAVFTPLDVAGVSGLKATLPAVYGNPTYGQEKPIVAQSAYNDAFTKTWSDAPQPDGTKAFATIFTGSLQEPTFKYTPGSPNGGFDKIVVDNRGSGYMSPPVPVIAAPPAGGIQATAATTLRVEAVTVVSPGAGYKFAPVVTFGNTGTGSGAAAVARMQVSQVIITNGGSGYDAANPPAVTFSAPDSRVPGAAQAYGIAVVDAGGSVTGVTFVGGTAGNGYTSAPLVAIAAPAAGTRATGSTELNIKSVAMVSNDPNHPEYAGGAGYTNMALVTVNITAPTGPNAVAAVATVSGSVADITLTNSGSGYAGVPLVTIPAPAVGTQATATATAGGGSILVKNKAIQELFDPTYGRMNATLGIEIPFTSALTQTTIPLGYVDPVTEEFADGETQIWKITHNGVDAHPVHFHLLNVQVINRIGWDGTIKAPMDNEYGWKETVRMNPLEDIVVAVRAKKPVLPGFGLPFSNRLMDPSQPEGVPMGFTQVNVLTGNPAVVTNTFQDLGWEYVWHCHILGHEENDFMRPVKFNANEAVPLAPTITALGPLAAGAQVNLTWVDNSQTEYKYEVTRMAVMAPGVAAVAVPPNKLLANATAYSEALPAIGGNVLTYAYQVAAIGANGTGAATVTVPVDVAAPTIGAAVISGVDSATISWTDNSVNETQFTVQQSADAGLTWTTVSTPVSATTVATAGVKTAVAAGLTPGVSYQFRVSAQLVAGATTFTSLPSATTAYTVPLAPTIPTIGKAVFASATSATISWTDNSVNETQFVVERSADAGVTWTTASTPASATPGATGGVASAAATGLTPGASYLFRVRAQMVVGAVTFTSLPSGTVAYKVALPPAAPTGVAFTIAANSNLLTATFTDASTNETQFVLSGGATALATIVSTTTAAVGGAPYNSGAINLVGLLAPGANYTIGVVAKDGVNGLQSTPANAPRTLNVTTVPTAAPLLPATATVTAANPLRTFTNLATAFTVPAQNGTTTYMPVTGYNVTYCQVSSPALLGAAIAVLANCNAGTSVTTTMSAPISTLNLGALLPALGNTWYKYVVSAKNLAGVSVATKTGASR